MPHDKQWFATWNWVHSGSGKRHEATMTFWAMSETNARHKAHAWWGTARPAGSAGADFSLCCLTAERF